MTELLPGDYAALLVEVKECVHSAQHQALRTVAWGLARLYRDADRVITKRQAGGSYGNAVVKRLAKDLRQEFPGMAGFSWRNLFNRSEFCAAYRDRPKVQPVAAITPLGDD